MEKITVHAVNLGKVGSRNRIQKNISSVEIAYQSMGLADSAGAVASLFTVTLRSSMPSPKKMTSTVISSLRKSLATEIRYGVEC